MNNIYTIGHSTRKFKDFVNLLKQHDIDVVCDVRSTPYSKYVPAYNQKPFKAALKKNGIKYIYLGYELGPRSFNEKMYKKGRVQYHRLAKQEKYKEGIKRVKKGIKKYKIVLLCSEKNPMICHRSLLVARSLKKITNIIHILDKDSCLTTKDFEDNLLKIHKLPYSKKNIKKAYKLQNQKTSYQLNHRK